jgi:hypothetical protein
MVNVTNNIGTVVKYKTTISTTSLLLVLFIGLKLTGYITWSWIWVLCPIWLPLAIALGAMGVVGIITVLVMLFLE